MTRFIINNNTFLNISWKILRLQTSQQQFVSQLQKQKLFKIWQHRKRENQEIYRYSTHILFFLKPSLFYILRKNSIIQYNCLCFLTNCSKNQLTMSIIQAIGIAGFRSYNPHSLQKIQFSKPLTLIWGPNGSGKTTIIEVMKYIMAGILPPSCQRGKNFIIDPRIVGLTEVKGEIRLRFKAYMGRPVMAVRRSMLTISQRGTKFQSTEQILKTKDENGDQIEINHHCAQIQKQIPFLLGTSKPIIDKVMFCHQEQSLWPFEDSAVLKTIFDELFETKKYTQMIEVLWDQRKQYQKKIGEIKKALPYLQRIYLQDKKKKYQGLKQMEEGDKQVKEIMPIRLKLQRMQAELADLKVSENGSERIRLAQEKRSLEDKIKVNNDTISKGSQKLSKIVSEFFKLTETKLTFQKDQTEFYIHQSESRINELKKQRQELSKFLQNIKLSHTLNQKQREMQNEIKAAKQYLPEIKRDTKGSISEQELVYKKIVQKKEELESKMKKIKQLQDEQRKCIEVSSKLVFERNMSQTQLSSVKARLASDTRMFQQTKLKILSFYFALYKPIDQKVTFCSKEDDVSKKLQQVSFLINLKRQELQKYQKMPKGLSITKKIDRMQFGGVQFYDTYIQYCNQKKKCSFCSKPMTDQQLRTITAKCQKIKEKSQAQIKELQKTLQKISVCDHPEGDPEVMIQKLTAEIENLVKSQKNLTEKDKNYKMAMQWRQQRKLNETLIQGIKIVKFQREVQTGSAKKYEKYSKEATIQLYSEYVRKYIDLSNQIAREKRNIEMYEQHEVRNRQKQIQKEKTQTKARAISQEINIIHQQTKNYQVIAKIVSKLTVLLKEKQKMKQFKPKGDKTQPIRAQLITQQISSIDQEIRKTELKTEFYTLNIEIEDLKRENSSIFKEITRFQQKINQLEVLFKERQRKQEQYIKLKTEFEKNAHSLKIRSDIAFSEYNRNSEKEYLLMKSRLQDAEKASQDIETYCRVVENTISKLHQQKMDQINKIISDIWREVYHEKDITSIQIETLINQDSKKRRNYHYSIVMYKAGPERIKVQMRGRCSMGQKVLASLVIRMALAEVFATSARFLALDEPTTNLDQEHIDSLARELIKIIELNEGGNFQMVIITHDMELIKKLEKYTNHFYEVNRDQNKFSVITKKDISWLYRKF